MNLEKVVFAFFIVLALTLNFGFVMGEILDPGRHNAYELFGALIISLIATVLKFGDRTHIGAVLLATSLVADLQLILASLVWGVVVFGTGAELTSHNMADIVSLASGALVANFASVVIFITETVMIRR